MDPVTAFGLAGTVATFVDFGMKFVKLTWAIYHEDDSPQVAELIQLTESFEEAANSIKLHDSQVTNSSEDRLKQLVVESVGFSSKLIERLRQEGLIGTQKYSAKKAFKTALRHIFRNKELNELKEKIVELEHQLSLQLLISLRQFATQTLKNQETILAALQVSSGNENDITSGIQAVLQHVTGQTQTSYQKQWQEELQSSMVQQVYQTSNSQSASEIVLSTQVIEWMNRIILSTLWYAGIEDRHNQIKKTFGTTFEWILDTGESTNQTWHGLSKWLASDESIFWISGKLGCGKSTVMKYLSSPIKASEPNTPITTRCHPFLRKWAGERRLIVAPFYFWASDPSQMQKSRTGMLRTLLYHILAARSDLIPIILSSRWEALAIAGVHEQLGKWTDTELHDYLFRALKILEVSNFCICFFIDGLDEFEDDPKLLIDLIRELSSLGGYVKLCVASRPWIEFQDAFTLERHLLLEDFTHNDIEFFVTRKFNDNPEFAKLQIREPIYAKKLISNVVSKGAGVFLWVALVVSSLSAGITNADRVEDLERRLQLMPSDLEGMYERILAGSDDFYHRHRAHMIMLMESAKRPLPLIIFALADEGNFDSLAKLPLGPERAMVLEANMDAMRRRLNSRWKGLLEVVTGETVTYLHRSVTDFVQSPRMQKYLSEYSDPSFDPHFQLSLAYCGFIRAQISGETDTTLNAYTALQHAKQTSVLRQQKLLRMINEFAQISPLHKSPSKTDRFWAICVFIQAGILVYVVHHYGQLDYLHGDLSDEDKLARRQSFLTVPGGIHATEAIEFGFLAYPMQGADIEELDHKIARASANSEQNPLLKILFESLLPSREPILESALWDKWRIYRL